MFVAGQSRVFVGSLCWVIFLAWRSGGGWLCGGILMGRLVVAAIKRKRGCTKHLGFIMEIHGAIPNGHYGEYGFPGIVILKLEF